jgi:K319-like protein
MSNQKGNLAHNGHMPPLKMVMTMMLMSVTLSISVIFPELSEIYALPSRGGGGGLPSHGSHSSIHPTGSAPLSGVHPNGPGSIAAAGVHPNGPGSIAAAGVHPNGPALQSLLGSHVINGPNGPHPNAPTVVNGPNGPRVVNGPNSPTVINGPNGPHPNAPTVVNGPNGPRVVNGPNSATTNTNTAIVHPSNCPTVVHPNGADTTVVHPSNCPSSGGQVNVNSGSTSSSSSLTVNNVQQQSSSSQSISKQQSSQSTIPIANAGSNINVHSSDQVKLDGSKSYDPNGHSLSYSWVQLSGGPAVSLSKDNTAKPTFVAPKVTDMSGTTTLTFQLVVNNGKSDSSPSYVSVSVKP